MSCYNNAIFYRTIETIHRWIGRTDTIEMLHSTMGGSDMGNLKINLWRAVYVKL